MTGSAARCEVSMKIVVPSVLLEIVGQTGGTICKILFECRWQDCSISESGMWFLIVKTTYVMLHLGKHDL